MIAEQLETPASHQNHVSEMAENIVGYKHWRHWTDTVRSLKEKYGTETDVCDNIHLITR